MAKRDTRRIAHERLDEPHISGRRISVRQIYALVEERGEDPVTVADRYDLDIAAVYHALAYYHDHPREMHTVEQERDDAMETIRDEIDRPGDVEPSSVCDEWVAVLAWREYRPEDSYLPSERRISC